MRAAARRHGVSLLTVQRWVGRAAGRPLGTVDWSDRPSAPRRQARRTSEAVEAEVLRLRAGLRDASELGDHGALAIHEGLVAAGGPVPSVRTIGRILVRHGAVDARRRVRHPAPPRGWYLPDVAAGAAELDAYDLIERIRLAGGARIEVLTGVSLHGGLVLARPGPPFRATAVVRELLAHWTDTGRPAYAQFDNAMCFHGSHGAPDVLGPVVLTALALEVTCVFAPVREHGLQAAVEGFNGRWQARVWDRTWHATLGDLAAASDRYVAAHRARHAARIARAPARAAMPDRLPEVGRVPHAGRVVFVRRTSDAGTAFVLGRHWTVDPAWPHGLVRGDLDLAAGTISFSALSRRDPADQPLLAVHEYRPLPRKHPTRR